MACASSTRSERASATTSISRCGSATSSAPSTTAASASASPTVSTGEDTMIAILFLLAAETVQINHVPVGEAVAGEPLAVTAEVANAHKLAVFALHFRHKGGSWKSAAFRKDEKGGWAAIIESKEVKPPALEYYLSAQEKGAPEVDRFASESAPHPVLVRVPRDD